MKNLLKNKIINKICIRLTNLFVPIKSKRRAIRAFLYNFILEAIKDELSLKYPDYYQFGMFCPWGDFYIPCSLFEEFKRKNNNVKILVVCANENQEKVLQSFPAVDKIIKINPTEYYSLFPTDLPPNYEQHLKIGRLYCLSHWLFTKANLNKSMNFLELYTKMLGLNYPAKRSLPSITNIDTNEYNNTILIYPETRSFTDKELTNLFWVNLADELTNIGFNIVFNTKKIKYGNYKTIFLPINEQIEIAKKCKFIIGMRSGFSDILAINNVQNHIVIYPKNMYFKTITQEQQEKEFSRCFVMEKSKTFSENMYRITSLKMFNNYSREIFYNNEKTLKDKIFNFIKEKYMKELTTKQKINEIIKYYKSTNNKDIAALYEEKLNKWLDYSFVDNNYIAMSKGKIQNKIINDKILEEKKLLKADIENTYDLLFANNKKEDN